MLIGLIAVFAAVVLYRVFMAEKPKTAPLVYPRGTVATSAVRSGKLAPPANADPILLLLSRREEKFPAVTRDLFRMENPAPRPKAGPAPVVPMQPAPPPVPVKTPEEIAADDARADLSKFRFLGYLTDQESSLFLSKDSELFIVKSGDTVLKNYKVKETGKDYVVLLDTISRVEVRIELSGSTEQAPMPMQAPRQMPMQAPRQMPYQMPRAPQPPE
jgi:hypothetical protein